MTPSAYCFHRKFEPGSATNFEVDRHYLLYAMRGVIRLEANGQRWTLPPARAALIAANHPIQITVLSQLTSASILFSTDFMPSPIQPLAVFEVSPLARELIRECRAWGADDGTLSPYATRVFQTLSDVALRLAKTPSTCVLPAPQSSQLQRAVELTEAQSHLNPTFEGIAKGSHQSPRALARRFSIEMGMTWREVLRHLRITKAVEALAMSDASVTEIAHAVGYESLSGFNAAFRVQMQMSPSAYRASFLA